MAVLWLAVVVLALLPVLGGCLSTGRSGGVSLDELAAAVREAGLGPENLVVPYELPPEAIAWLEAEVPKRGQASDQLNLLLDRMMAEDGLALKYQAHRTRTAAEVFTSREADCLGFLNLYVGFARHLGLPVFYAAVEDVENFEREGDLVVISDHVAAGYGLGSKMLLLEFTDRESIEYKHVVPLTDVNAVARYYSDRGGELLIEDDVVGALPWLLTAVRIDPSQATAWTNLGVAKRRSGDSEGAHAAYLRALEEDPKLAVAYQNLAALLRLDGREEEAHELMALTDDVGSRNPYNYLSLGDWSRNHGRFDEARDFYRRALALSEDAAEPYAALGQLEMATGNKRKARRWLRRAEAIDPDEARTRRLRQRLSTGDR